MFKLSSISASTEFQPLKEPKTEIPSVELVAEFVKVELQEFRLYVMVGVKDAPLGVADGDMHPRQNLSDFFLVIHDNGLVGSHCPVLFKGCVCAGTVRSGICLPVCRLFYPGSFGGSLQIVYYLHLYVSHDFRGTPLLIGRSVRETAFSHDKDGCLALASTSTFERAVFLSLRRLGGEEPFVYLHISMKIIACVTLAHHVTKLVHHFPYGLVTLAPQLALDFLGGYGTFGRRQKVHGGEPVADGQVASLHHSTGTQGHLMLTVHAGPRTVARIPTQTQTAAAATEKTVAFTETTESLLAGAFVRILTVEVKQIHCVSFQLFYMECLQILFLCLHWHLRACLNFANLDVCGHSFSKYQNKPLWSVGGSWNIYKEKFFQADFVDMLKLRASYGIGGNIGRNTAPYLIASYYDSSLVDGMAGSVNTPPNKDIRWEKTTTVNVGVDFALFRHRLSGTIEYYNKYSVDLLAAINGSPTQGFGYTTLMTNNGKMVNRGVEITLSGEIIRQKDFSWNASLLYAFNRNKVKHISVQPSLWDSRISMPTSYPMVGKPLYGIYAYKWAGLNENGDPQVYDAENNVTSGPARDYHALVYCGTTVPIHNASLTNVLRYKGFEFSAMLILDAGHKLRSSNIPSINMSNGRITSTAKGIVDRWTQPGDVTDVPRLLFSNDTENFNTHRTELYRYSDLFVYDASNIRLSNISLAYRVPAHWCKKISLSGARLQFNVENVATFAFDSKANYDLGGKVKPNYVWGLYLNF